jgi:hypothetical protein
MKKKPIYILDLHISSIESFLDNLWNLPGCKLINLISIHSKVFVRSGTKLSSFTGGGYLDGRSFISISQKVEKEESVSLRTK